MTVPNARVLASLDPSNTPEEIADISGKWSTMFFGDDTPEAMSNRYACPKTHHHATGHCAKCLKGCFGKGRVDVHLKQH